MTWERSGLWSRELLDRLSSEVQEYFRAYYSELRRLTAEHEDADLPYWFWGGRQIVTSACTDGLVIAHSPYDVETHTFPEREDSFSFCLGPADQGISVGELVRDSYSPTFPDGGKMEVMPVYPPGEDFGYYLIRTPAYEGFPAGEGYSVGSISDWTRLDVASRSYLHVWRDRERAERDAWEAVRPYVEDDDQPVPRPL